ncbi:MAG: formate dehydrogenase subunit gamma [Candidatus Binataceae bacterium]
MPTKPSSSRSADFDSATIDKIIAARRDLPGALLPILHEINRHFGYIPPQAVAVIAAGLNLSRAEVHGVVSFYHDFRTAAPGRHVIRICRAESCQAMGSAALEDHITRTIGAGVGQTSDGGEFTFEAVYCFGNCACSPALAIDGELHGRATPLKFDAALALLRKET